MEWLDAFISVFGSGLRLSVPLLFACLAGLFAERSGIVDIGLEGKLVAAAFAAGAVAGVTGSAWLGLFAAMLVSVLLALVHGFVSITHRGNQIVSGVAINFLASGITVLLGQAWFSQGGRTPPLLGADARFNGIVFPYAQDVGQGIGKIYSHLISGQTMFVYLALAVVPMSWWLLYRTRFGLRLRAVGENPHATDTAGISVTWVRYMALTISGALCGLGGAYLAIAAPSSGFIRDMSAGRGFIALAALVFAKWKPVPALFTCLLFGILDAMASRLEGTDLPFVGQVPVQIFQALPYVLTVVLLAGFIGKAVPPKASGVPYTKDR